MDWPTDQPMDRAKDKTTSNTTDELNDEPTAETTDIHKLSILKLPESAGKEEASECHPYPPVDCE